MGNELNIGDIYFDEYGEVKIICFVEKNYLVAKRKGAIPFIRSKKDFLKEFQKKHKKRYYVANAQD